MADNTSTNADEDVSSWPPVTIITEKRYYEDLELKSKVLPFETTALQLESQTVPSAFLCIQPMTLVSLV